MRKIGAFIAVAILAVVGLSGPPAEAFGIRIGPFHFGFPFFFHHHRHHLYMRANPNDTARREQQSQPAINSALLYPNQALSVIFQNILWPSNGTVWPFSYGDIFSTAFAKGSTEADARQCQPAIDASQIVGRIGAEVSPTADQMQLLQKLGGALGAASGYLAKACPSEIPAQPVARLQLMESQTEELAMAIDMVRQPLADFEQSLNADQQAKFSAVSPAPADADQSTANPATGSISACDGTLNAIDSSIDQIEKSVQPTDAQHGDVDGLKQSFTKAASDLQAHCPTAVPKTAVGRLETIEARLDATWRSELAIQVALANFENKLTAEQKDRFDQMNFASQ